MKTLLTTTALVALLSAAPAFAQSDTAPVTEEPPAATQEMAPDAGMTPSRRPRPRRWLPTRPLPRSLPTRT